MLHQWKTPAKILLSKEESPTLLLLRSRGEPLPPETFSSGPSKTEGEENGRTESEKKIRHHRDKRTKPVRRSEHGLLSATITVALQ